MKIFTSTDFRGHWPVGTAAVVIAENADDAKRHLWDALTEHGLGVQDGFSVQELDGNRPGATILRDGDY